MSWFPEQAGNGLDRMYHGLIRHLPDAGVPVAGVVAGSPRVQVESNGLVRAFAREDSPLVQRIRHLRRTVRAVVANRTINVAASHFALYTAPVLDLLPDCPLIVHFHGPWGAESRAEGESIFSVRTKTWIEQAVYRRGTAFITLSDAFRQILVRDFDVDPARVHLIPGGVDANRFDTGMSRREARERLDWPTDRPIVVSVRRLAHRMGLENLIEAVRLARRRIPDLLVHIAGKGPLEDALRAQISGYGLENHVRLLGFVPEADLPLTYRAADLSIVPTVALEGFGLITVESLAAGTPVLVTPHGGLPEVVSNLDPGLVLPGDTPEVLARGLTDTLLGNHPLPPADACQQHVRERFDWPVVAEATGAVYHSVLA
jgi:glycosyltransferase involved in cell wall biosynthesis